MNISGPSSLTRDCVNGVVAAWDENTQIRSVGRYGGLKKRYNLICIGFKFNSWSYYYKVEINYIVSQRLHVEKSLI